MDYILLRKRKPTIKFITEDNLPVFVRFEDSNNCLRLVRSRIDGRGIYYRDGGDYQVEIKIKGGKLYSWSHVESVNNVEMNACTYEEWKESNGHYAPEISKCGVLK